MVLKRLGEVVFGTRLCWALLAWLLSSGEAHAFAVTWAFEATVVSQFATHARPGDAVVGSFTFESTAQDRNPDPAVGRYGDFVGELVLAFEANFAGLPVVLSGVGAALATPDSYALGIVARPTAYFEEISFEFQFEPPGGGSFSQDALWILPPPLGSLAPYSGTNLFILFLGQGESATARLKNLTLVAIPEPASGALLTLGLGLLVTGMRSGNRAVMRAGLRRLVSSACMLRWSALFIAASVTLPLRATAAPVTWGMDARWVSSFGEFDGQTVFGIELGQVFTGTLTFESTTPDAFPEYAATGEYEDAITGWASEISAVTFAEGVLPSGDNIIRIERGYNEFLGRDVASFVAVWNLVSPSPTTIALVLIGRDMQAFTTDELAPWPPDVSLLDAQNSTLLLSFDGAPNVSHFANIERLFLVPESSTATLSALGCLGAFALRRRYDNRRVRGQLKPAA